MIDFDRILGWAIVGLIFLAVFGGIWQSINGDHTQQGPGLLTNGAQAPAFAAFRHGDHVQISNDDWKGKVVVIDFWGTWCHPCREEAPIIRQVSRDYSAEQVMVVAADDEQGADDPEANVSRFLKDSDLDGYPVVYPVEGVLRRYKVEYFPSIYVIGKDGRVRFSATGHASRRTLHQEIDAALAEHVESAPPS